jgi:hypothetical protein
MRRSLALVLLLSGVAHADAPRAKLGVLVAVDGLSWERLNYYRPWYRAGLKRLLDEGLIETEARYRHLNSETGPGHSALSTGAPPRVTGIVANAWYERDPKGVLRSRYCVDEHRGEKTLPGPEPLRVKTLGDELAEAHKESRVVSISTKDRAAILMAGHTPADAVYWWDQTTGRFVSSPVYAPTREAQAVVDRVNAKGSGPARFGLLWRPLPAPEDQVLPQPTSDLEDFQIPANGLGFPHSLTFSPRGYFQSLYVTPFIDELLADLAVGLLEDKALGLGRGESPDFLAISFSAHDTVAHNYGTESEEALDVLRRLDLDLGRVFTALDELGPRVALGFSSDHGFLKIPEVQRLRGGPFKGGRLVSSSRTYPSFTERLNRLLDLELCLVEKSQPLLVVDTWSVSYNRADLPFKTKEGSCGPPGREVGTKEIDSALPKVVGRFFKEEIEEVLLVSRKDEWPASDPAVEFARNDFDPDRSGDAFLVPKPGVLMHWDPGRGSGHGSHHEYDIHVPLVFWGAAFPRGEAKAASTPYDLAPTLAELLGVKLPSAVGRSLVPR